MLYLQNRRNRKVQALASGFKGLEGAQDLVLLDVASERAVTRPGGKRSETDTAGAFSIVSHEDWA